MPRGHQYAQYGPVPRLELVPLIPTKTLRPRKNGSPQSNPPDILAPSSANTILDVLKSAVALPIIKDIAPLGEPVDPVLTAEKVVVVGGQNQPELQSGNMLVDVGVKNRPFDPVSRKLE